MKIQVGEVYPTKNYGDLKVIEYKSWKEVIVKFLDTGYIASVTSNSIRIGQIKDRLKPSVYEVGFIGDGGYNSKENKDAYKCWNSIMTRSYCPKYHQKQPTYKDCKVHTDWHNFQNFAKWYEASYPKDGKEYHLDKDIKVKGNKVYSADTCIFVSRCQNNIEAKARHFKFANPEGEIINIYNLTEFCRSNNLQQGNMNSVHNGKRKHHKNLTKAL